MLRWMGMAADAFPVVHVGGLFRAPGVLTAFREVVEGACPQALVGPPLLPPVLGAVLLAMEAGDRRPGHGTLEALAAGAEALRLP